MAITKGMMSSDSPEWATPQAFFDALDAEFHFTLDVCATPENAKCARFFTEADDGLTQSWAGETVWMNPPYGRVIGDWMRKARNESVTGGVCRGVLGAR
jgi:phage N-6-adenine-methyltransferase